MRRSNEQSSIADRIAHRAIDLGLVLRVPRDPACILEIASIPKNNHCLDFLSLLMTNFELHCQ
jgi:hypothetical protein